VVNATVLDAYSSSKYDVKSCLYEGPLLQDESQAQLLLELLTATDTLLQSLSSHCAVTAQASNTKEANAWHEQSKVSSTEQQLTHSAL
jgi:hypothetical protein